MRPVELLQIEPTTRCNFTCGFCCGRAMTQTDLDPALLARALADFPEVRHVELQGEGEPLLHPRFFEMVAAAREHGAPVSFITNGSHFTLANIARILEGGIEKIGVSIESADATTFRALRGGKLEKVIAGVERLIAARDQRGLPRPTVGFVVTVLRGTRDQWSGILALYHRLGLDGGVGMQPLQQMTSYTAVYDDAMASERLDRDEADALWLRYLGSRAVRHIQRERRSTQGFHEELMAGWRPLARRCPWLDKGLYVDRNGVASACCMIKDEQHALGRLGVDSPKTILTRREAMRATLARGEIPTPCRGCEIAHYAVATPLGVARRGIRAGLRVLKESA